MVSLCLIPATVWGVLIFGANAAFVLLISISAAVAGESLVTLASRRFTLGDGSAVLTGLLAGLLMPPGIPLYVPAVASLFAILVVKQSFGGLGRNWMNPAMAGIVFALFSWTGAMTHWSPPRGAPVDATVMTPLEALRAASPAAAASGNSSLAILGNQGYPFSAFDTRVTEWLNSHLLSPLGGSLSHGAFDLVVGNIAGRIGAISAPLLLLGAAFLIARRIIRWEIPAVYVGVFLALTAVFGGLPAGRGWGHGAVFVHLFSGSLIIAGFFMATDPVTSPLMRKGRILYGAVLGALTFVFRSYGMEADGVPFALVLGNCFVPLIDALGRTGRRAREKAIGA
jgi:electron transport complex protein RnfD